MSTYEKTQKNIKISTYEKIHKNIIGLEVRIYVNSFYFIGTLIEETEYAFILKTTRLEQPVYDVVKKEFVNSIQVLISDIEKEEGKENDNETRKET